MRVSLHLFSSLSQSLDHRPGSTQTPQFNKSRWHWNATTHNLLRNRLARLRTRCFPPKEMGMQQCMNLWTKRDKTWKENTFPARVHIWCICMQKTCSLVDQNAIKTLFLSGNIRQPCWPDHHKRHWWPTLCINWHYGVEDSFLNKWSQLKLNQTDVFFMFFSYYYIYRKPTIEPESADRYTDNLVPMSGACYVFFQRQL